MKELSGDWKLGLEEVRARHPGIEPHLVHPEIGVVALSEAKQAPHDEELGGRWLELSAEEQFLRLRDTLAGLLELARAGDAQAQLRVGDGPVELLDDAAVARLLHGPLDEPVLVERDGRRWCELPWWPDRERWRWFVVWADPWKVGELEQRLSQAWWEPAERRQREREGLPLPVPRDGGRVSRPARGQALSAWHRGSAVAVPIACVLLAGALPLPWLPSALIAVVSVIAIGWTVEGALRRWYRRS